MASRINKRFLLVVIAVAGVVAVVVGGIALLAYRDDPTRNLRRAEALIEEGDLNGAAAEYARAVSKRPSDLEILGLYEQTLLQIEPESQERAEELYGNWLSALRQRSQVLSSDPNAALGLLREIYRNARITGNSGWWIELAKSAKEAKDRCDPADDGYSELAFLQLAADSNQISMEGPDAVMQMETRFEEFLAEHPAHAEAAGRYALLLLGEAHAAALGQNATAARTKLARAQAVIDDTRQRRGDDPELALADARILIARRFQGEAVEPGDMQAVADRIVNLIASSEERFHLNEAITLLPAMLGRTGADRAIELLQSFLDRNPDGVLERFGLARLLRETDRQAEALREIQHILDSEPLPVSFFATYRYELQLQSAQILFFIEHERAAGLAGAELEAQTARAVSARDRLAELAPGGDANLYVMECDAWLALARGDFPVAVSKFHAVVERTPLPDPRKLWGYARALDMTGSTGGALEMLREAMEGLTPNVGFLYEVARLESKVGLFVEAASHLEQALEIDPQHIASLQLLNQVRVETGDTGATADETTTAINAAQELVEANDLAGARSMLLAALEENPDNENLLVALIQVESRGEWREEAMARVDQLIAKYPESPQLQALRESVRGGDPIAVARAAVQATHSEPADFAAFMYIAMRRLADEQLNYADELDAAGRRDEADAARLLAERADAEAVTQLRDAKALGASQPGFIDRQFVDAVNSGDTAEARRLANLAREGNLDQARGLTYDARIELHARDFAKAVVTLVDASKAKPYDPWIWRTLAITYLELGNMVDARSAFNNAIAQNPNDPITIRMFARTLAESGSYAEALEVLRDAVSRKLNDLQLREQWLALEAERGDAASAIRERRRRYSEQPEDRANALQLAGLLGSRMPARESILDASLEPIYTERQWSVMGTGAREQAIGAARQQWITEADGIFEQLAASSGADLNLAAAHAMHLRATGRAQEGRELLEAAVQAELAKQPASFPYATMAQYLFVINAHAEAEKWLNDGMPFQDPTHREIERSLASFYLSTNRPERALEYITSALEGRDDRDLRLVAAEIMINLGRFDDAEAQLATLREAGAEAFQIEMLRARLAGGRAQALFAQSMGEEAARAVSAEREAIDRAIQVRAVDPRPYVMKANSFLQEFRRTGMVRPALLQDASTQVERALQLSAGFVPALQLRAELLLARTPPDVNGAVRELTALLESNRWDEATRRRIIELHIATNEVDRAIAVTRAGDVLEPHRPEWAVLLGQLLERKGDQAGAAEAYRQAYLRGKNPAVLQMWAVASLRIGTPSAIGDVVATLGTNAGGFQEHPSLQCVYAQALAMSDRFDEARNQLRDARANFKRLVDSKERPTALSDWMRMTAETFRDRRSVGELDAFVHEVAAGQLSRGEAFWLGREFATTENGRPRALALYQMALADAIAKGDTADQTELHYHVGETSHALGDYPAAAQAYGAALAINPDHVLSLNNLAYLYVTKIPQPEKALPLAERAMSLVPNNANVLDTYGVALLRAGRVGEAIEPLQKSIQLAPQSETHLHMAQVMAELQRRADAQVHLQQAAQMNPSAEVLQQINELRQRIGE